MKKSVLRAKLAEEAKPEATPVVKEQKIVAEKIEKEPKEDKKKKKDK